MYSYGPPHMAKQKRDDLLEHTYSSYVRIRDVALKTCHRRWTIVRSGERGSGISVLAARHDDDDDLLKILTPVGEAKNKMTVIPADERHSPSTKGIFPGMVRHQFWLSEKCEISLHWHNYQAHSESNPFPKYLKPWNLLWHFTFSPYRRGLKYVEWIGVKSLPQGRSFLGTTLNCMWSI